MGNRCNDDDNDVFCREEEDDADKYAARRNSLADLCVILLHRLLLDMAGSVYALEMCFRGSIDTVQGAAEAYNILCWLAWAMPMRASSSGRKMEAEQNNLRNLTQCR